jgi:hypothetical protein
MYSLERVKLEYNKIKNIALTSVKKGKWNKALEQIEGCARYAYAFNHIFKDDELEDAIGVIARSIIIEENCSQQDVEEKKYIFYDYFGTYNKGCSLQYLRALMSWNIRFLYICYSENDRKIEELKTYSKASIFIIEKSLERTEQIKLIHRIVTDYKGSDAFIYTAPWDVVGISAFRLLHHTKRYLINITDHAFWLGVKSLDYSIEFRTFGYTLSSEKRGLSKESLLMQPFYPVVMDVPFQGFPSIVTPDKVVIFSGGAYYKIYGKGNKFFDLMKAILTENSNAIILYAGWGTSAPIKSFIRENHLENRLLLIGVRKDLSAVMEKCDIYLGTYPLCGGLMTQYAAAKAKPIVSYSDPESLPHNDLCDLLSSVGQNTLDVPITFTDERLFLDRMAFLIRNKRNREQSGNQIRSLVLTPTQFNEHLYKLINTQKNDVIPDDKTINYKLFTEQYIELENSYINTAGHALLKMLKMKSFFINPSSILRTIKRIIQSKIVKII